MSRLKAVLKRPPLGVFAEVYQSLILSAVGYLGAFRAYIRAIWCRTMTPDTLGVFWFGSFCTRTRIMSFFGVVG